MSPHRSLPLDVRPAGQVELELKTPWRDGTTHSGMSPLKFMQRLDVLVQRPIVRSGMTASGR